MVRAATRDDQDSMISTRRLAVAMFWDWRDQWLVNFLGKIGQFGSDCGQPTASTEHPVKQ